MVIQLIFSTRVPKHVQPVGRPTALWHLGVCLCYEGGCEYVTQDMGQQMGYRSLEWNWPKEAMKIPLGRN